MTVTCATSRRCCDFVLSGTVYKADGLGLSGRFGCMRVHTLRLYVNVTAVKNERWTMENAKMNSMYVKPA